MRYRRWRDHGAGWLGAVVKVIDTHAHFWDVEKLSYPWIEKGSFFDKRFSLADYQRAAGVMPIDKMVFIECDAHPALGLKEAEWVEALSRVDGRIQGIVARVQLTNNSDVASDLDLLASMPLVKGIRHNIQRNPPGFALQSSFVEGIKEGHRRGFHFELCLTHDQLGETIELVERCKDVSFVLDHCGKPGIRDGSREPWRTQIRELARLPNVICKISGLLTEADWNSWTVDEVLWYAQESADAFGRSRIMFGSDWPVNEAAGGYGRWRDLTDALTSGWGADEKREFYYSNAERFYRL
jgi:L-fuconolactonase